MRKAGIFFLMLLAGVVIGAPVHRVPDRLYVASGTWTPAELSSLELWFDSSDYSTLWSDINATTQATSGGNVLRWDDKSDSGLDLISASPAVRGASDDGLVFSRDESFATGYEISSLTSNKAASAFIVCKSDALVSNGDVYGFYSFHRIGSRDFMSGFVSDYYRFDPSNIRQRPDIGSGNSTASGSYRIQNIDSINSYTNKNILSNVASASGSSFSNYTNGTLASVFLTQGTLPPSGFLGEGSNNHRFILGARIITGLYLVLEVVL